jgi:type II secretory pathway pseudopilin PulG
MTRSAYQFLLPRATSAGVLHRARHSAFTLVEVLATLLLMGIALITIVEAFGAVTSAATTSQQRAQAAALAESKLHELIATTPGNASSGSTTSFALAATSGDFGAEAPGFTWTAEINSWGQPIGVQATNQLQELDVHVIWKRGNRQEQITASTLVYQSANTSTSSSATGGSS